MAGLEVLDMLDLRVLSSEIQLLCSYKAIEEYNLFFTLDRLENLNYPLKTL
jgi:hypothetical protein